jgi:hypothetical protein
MPPWIPPHAPHILGWERCWDEIAPYTTSRCSCLTLTRRRSAYGVISSKHRFHLRFLIFSWADICFPPWLIPASLLGFPLNVGHWEVIEPLSSMLAWQSLVVMTSACGLGPNSTATMFSLTYCGSRNFGKSSRIIVNHSKVPCCR